MQFEKVPLPIDPYLPEIIKGVQDYSTIIIKASPGSGKTTRLPWALAQQLRKKVVVLEPRRLAAKLAAGRIAFEEKLKLGKDVGYHFRFEKSMDENTQVVFYTEGTFLKKFLQDKLLEGIDVVVLDEFHERHLETDLALALLLNLQKTRKDLKIVIMSATLDLKLLDSFHHGKTIEIHAPRFPVEISYLPNQPSVLNQSLESKVKKAVESYLNRDGHILVFLPGMREMFKAREVLHGDYNVFLLHADLTKEEQEEALEDSDTRKIILATNIAESSVTIPGITCVIDSGIQREATYSPWNGLKLIGDTPITKSSAVQRAGRAGRTSPGVCMRLFSEQDFNEREEFTIPEIFRADLVDTYLFIKGSGLSPLWMSEPPKEKWTKAQLLCQKLGLVDERESLTEIGKKVLHFPLDARLSRILIAGEDLKLKQKETLLRYICQNIEGDRSGHLYNRLKFYLKDEGSGNEAWEKCLLSGFIDQVARLRPKQKDFIHYSGKILKAHPSLTELHDDFYIIFDITKRQEAIQVFPIEESWLWDHSPFPLTEEDELEVADKITQRHKTKLGSIVLDEEITKPEWNGLNEMLKQRISELSLNTFLTHFNQWKESPVYGRIHFWAKKQGKNPEEIEKNLRPKDYFEVNPRMNWEGIEYYFQTFFEEALKIQNLEKELPFKLNLGGKRELTVHYPIGMDPYLEAPIQDFYGLKEVPKIMNGSVALTLKLIGPHKRPMQVTRDLKSFWEKTYSEMKKEYQRDYPRHYWPDKPWEAKPILLKRQLPEG